MALLLVCSLVPANALRSPELAFADDEQLSLDITKQPVGGTFANGATVRLYAQASASGGVLAYEWHRVNSSGTDVKVGSNSSICDDVSNPAAGTYAYYVKVTNTSANGSSLIRQSDGAQVTVVSDSHANQVANGNFESGASRGNLPSNAYEYYYQTLSPWDTTEAGLFGKVFERPPLGEITGPKSPLASGSVAELAAESPSCLYQEVSTVPGKIFRWSLNHAGRQGTDTMAVVIGPALTDEESKALGYSPSSDHLQNYRYGKNDAGYFNAIVNSLPSKDDGTYSVAYQGRQYYVCILRDGNSEWGAHSGVYTVPEGQGISVFAFVSVARGGGVRPNMGNWIDNIAFAAGGGIIASSDVGYEGDGSLSVDTQVGYSYGLVEERGSAVTLVSNVTYAVGGADPSPYDGGWLASTSVSQLVFGNLTPGKTYRVVGVPTSAAGDMLGLNAKPASVLDEEYYDSFVIKAVSGGSSSSTGNVQIQATIDAATKKAAIIVDPTRADVDYALLACQDGTAASADTGSPAAAWTQGTGAQLRFEGLERGASYLVIARPHGYFEVGYADAAASGVIGTTPGVDFRDVAAADVERTASAPSAIAIGNTTANQVYCVYDTATGVRQENKVGTGGAVSFTGLDPTAAYQVVTAPSGSVFSQGVRSYPAAPALAVDFAGEQAGTGVDGAGAVSTEVEYRMQAVDGHWLYGDDSTWVAGTGGQAVSLANALQRMADDGCASATLSYRLKGDADTESVSIEEHVTVPARSAFDNAACAVSFEGETMGAAVGSAGIDVSADGWKSYTSLEAGSSAGLSSFGWNGSAKTLSVRTRAAATAFASLSGEVQVPARPASPSSADVSLAVDTGSGTASIANVSSAALEYRAQGAAVSDAWTALAPHASAAGIALPDSSAFDVRFAAVEGSSFASRSFTLSASTASLNVSAPDVVDLTYGYRDADYAAQVAVKNSGIEAATVSGVSVTGPIELLGPEKGQTIAAGAVDDSSWTIKPQANLPAGAYEASVVVKYTGGSTDVTVYRAVHEFSFIVAKADQTAPVDVSVSVQSDVAATMSASLPAESVAGAALEYSVDGKTWVDDPAFTGLVPAADYTFSARLKESANHYASPASSVIARTAHRVPDVSALSVNYVDETLSFSASANEVATVDAEAPASDQLLASGSSVSAYAGATIYLRAKETPATDGALATPASPWRAVTLPERPVAPSATTLPATSSADDDGSISVPGAEEFAFRATGSDGSWVTVPSSSIGKRGAGSYEVRIPATATSFASASAAATVGVQYAFVVFDPADGTPTPVTQKVQIAQPDGTQITAYVANPVEVAKSGFRFLGWFAEGSTTAWNFATDSVTGDLRLTAGWEEVVHPVAYYLNDGAAADPYHVDEAVRFETKLVAPDQPSRGGYAFGGWWTSSDGGATLDVAWDFANSTMPDAEVSLYAKWTPVFEASVPVSLKGSVSAADGTVALPAAASYRIVSKTPAPLAVESVEFAYAAAEGSDPLIASGRSNVAFSVNGEDVAGAKAGTSVVPANPAKFTVPAAVWSSSSCVEGLLELQLSMALNGAVVNADPDTGPFATIAFTLAMDEDGR